jgi:electron transfer flavoprotein beta subunit
VLDGEPTLSGLSRAVDDAAGTTFEGEPSETAAEIETLLRDAGVGAE